MSADYEKLLKQRFDICDWNQQEQHEEQSFRIIVKNYIPETTSFKINMIQKMKKNILALNSMSVYVMNIQTLNYRNDLLMNFSASWTWLHLMIWARAVSISQIHRELKLDKVYFDKMIDKANEEDAICSEVQILLSYSYMSRLCLWNSIKKRLMKVSSSILDDNLEEMKQLNNFTSS